MICFRSGKGFHSLPSIETPPLHLIDGRLFELAFCAIPPAHKTHIYPIPNLSPDIRTIPTVAGENDKQSPARNARIVRFSLVNWHRITDSFRKKPEAPIHIKLV